MQLKKKPSNPKGRVIIVSDGRGANPRPDWDKVAEKLWVVTRGGQLPYPADASKTVGEELPKLVMQAMGWNVLPKSYESPYELIRYLTGRPDSPDSEKVTHPLEWDNGNGKFFTIKSIKKHPSDGKIASTSTKGWLMIIPTGVGAGTSTAPSPVPRTKGKVSPISPPAPAPATPKYPFQISDIVTHSKYGTGKIVGLGSDLADVDFAGTIVRNVPLADLTLSGGYGTPDLEGSLLMPGDVVTHSTYGYGVVDSVGGFSVTGTVDVQFKSTPQHQPMPIPLNELTRASVLAIHPAPRVTKSGHWGFEELEAGMRVELSRVGKEGTILATGITTALVRWDDDGSQSQTEMIELTLLNEPPLSAAELNKLLASSPSAKPKPFTPPPMLGTVVQTPLATPMPPITPEEADAGLQMLKPDETPAPIRVQIKSGSTVRGVPEGTKGSMIGQVRGRKAKVQWDNGKETNTPLDDIVPEGEEPPQILPETDEEEKEEERADIKYEPRTLADLPIQIGEEIPDEEGDETPEPKVTMPAPPQGVNEEDWKATWTAKIIKVRERKDWDRLYKTLVPKKIKRKTGMKQKYIPRYFEGVEISDMELLRKAYFEHQNVLLQGPPGSGKTRSLEELAANLQIPYFRIEMHGGMEISDLLGTYVPSSTEDEKKFHGDFMWNDGLLTKFVRYGGIFVADEINAMPPELTTKLHGLLDYDRTLVIPEKKRKQKYPAHPGFMFVASMNPETEGLKLSDPMMDRFDVVLNYEYDKKIEDAMKIPESLSKFASKLRWAKAEEIVDKHVSTRMLLQYMKNVSLYGEGGAKLILISKFDKESRPKVKEAFEKIIETGGDIDIEDLRNISEDKDEE